MSLCVLRAASRLHERIAYTKLLPARVIQPYRKQQYEMSEFTTAMKVPDQMFKQKYGFDKPKPDDPVVFICTTGARSYIALRNALRMGYKNFSTSAWCQDAQKTPVKISADKALSYDDLVNLIARKELYLVDVREPRELQETGELPGSVNIPLTELQSALKDLSENDFQKKYGAKKPGLNAPLIFSCRSGARSLKALQLALDLGYTKAKHYKGGYSDWEEHTKPKTS
ncbi:thiosulfate:glutathione sulfurtransferase-like isoform X2 [Schistocerca piceifrons]|uniref:thiosulfate:glutathione sulfurtransferase-like isoform X2 n=1 Tax=Schistocerca piceifrons TaxID=274613 RepID=UPI001F5FCF3F|nr:thiosulfate:glutathione sulfurtransferase-like isoform X2 [Schistocerca piceifrons]